MLKSFPCNSCGLCCQNISEVEELQKYDNGNGVCIHLDENHQCRIYDKRPLICRIDLMFDKVYFQHFTKDEYYYHNALACRKLQEQAGFKERDMINLRGLLEGQCDERREK